MKLGGSHIGGTQGELEWGRELDMIKTHCMSIHRNFSRDKLKVLFCVAPVFLSCHQKAALTLSVISLL